MKKELIKRAMQLFSSSAAGSSRVLSDVARRLNIDPADATPTRIIGMMKDNPVTTAMVLMDLGNAGYDLARQLGNEDPAIAEILTFAPPPEQQIDEVINMSQLSMFQDEFDVIRRVVGQVGSESRLRDLLHVIRMDPKILVAYTTVQALSR